MKKKADKTEGSRSAARGSWPSAQNLFVTGYEKLTVAQDFELRKTVRGAGGQLPGGQEQPGRERRPKARRRRSLLKDLTGMTSMAYTAGDPVALAKALTAYAKANPDVSPSRPGMVEGRVIDVTAIQELATHAVARKRFWRSCCS